MSTSTFHQTVETAPFRNVTQLDPRVRIVCALVLSCLIVWLNSLPALLCAVGGAAALMVHTRLPLIATVKKVLTMDSFIIFMLFMLPFTTAGEEWFHIGPLVASWEGLFKAIEITLKANAIILLLLTLVATIEVTVMGHALHRLRVPENLIHLMLFCVRYIDVLKQEYLRLKTAMKARCFRPANSLHTYRSVGYLLGMLLVRSLERSERIHAAMKCRGFQGKFYLLEEFTLKRGDFIFMAFTFIFALALAILELSHVQTG